MITIKDIADKAGVSPTTVSNVLHGRTEKVSKDTLEYVQKIIEESNYVSNMGARLIANYGSRIIGVIMMYGSRNEKNALQDPFFSEIVGALEREIRNSQYYMMLYTSASVEESLKLALAWNIEGLIVLGAQADDCRRLKENISIPIVFIDCYFNNDQHVYANVGLCDEEGAYKITNYLIDNGHKKIAFLCDSQFPVGVSFFRKEGCQRALRERGIECSDKDLIYISHIAEERYQLLDQFYQSRIKEYTALFFSSDFYAVDGVHFLHDKGMKVPEDISIVGFDDNIYASQCRPQITTVHQDTSQKAVYAIDLLQKLIQGKEVEEYDIKLPIRIVIRDSVKKIED